MVWPLQKYARGENTKINYGIDNTGKKSKRAPKFNVDEMRTSSYGNQTFRSISMEKQEGMGGFPEDGDR
jgi:hypothetical protein